ncbi:hypothetical protein [Streptomyces acidiscabies]|uniref:Uncharacterized protein n=1 Tax=Streptomyces acidiscabies TaxID=42234 RepID=A0A0L0JE07_9ACTN|nr:hypothetical protein [Streptomyces acidiscabies]KND23694.1 hypothetical protein IQ63_43925 [Streptomyces acidiscabies]
MKAPARIRATVDSALGKPGSVRHSLAVLGTVAASTVMLLALADGAAAAATGLALVTVVALALGLYAAGVAAQGSGYRKPVRLLDSRAPALGGWRRIVADTFADDGETHFDTVMRPQLQRLFAARLAERHGVAMYQNPQRARSMVGAELWPWIDPESAAPQPTLPEPVLRSLLDRLETL